MHIHSDEDRSNTVQRFEVFTGAGRRRLWSAEQKAAIVAESYAGVESVSAVARRHGIGGPQLFGWRRQLREACSVDEIGSPLFVPAVVEGGATPPSGPGGGSATMLIKARGITISVSSQASPKLVTSLVAVLANAR